MYKVVEDPEKTSEQSFVFLVQTCSLLLEVCSGPGFGRLAILYIVICLVFSYRPVL